METKLKPIYINSDKFYMDLYPYNRSYFDILESSKDKEFEKRAVRLQFLNAVDYYTNKLFNHCLNDIEWLVERTARKECFMSDKLLSYSYGKGEASKEYKSIPFTEEISKLLYNLNKAYNTEYNACFLNRYDDQHSALGYHKDDFVGMDQSHPIGVMSLGAQRQIWWKEDSLKGEIPPENKVLLEPGSFFIMPGGFQDKHLHKIPKHNQPCGIRISLTFRKFI